MPDTTLQEIKDILKELSISQKETETKFKETDAQFKETTDKRINDSFPLFQTQWGEGEC